MLRLYCVPNPNIFVVGVVVCTKPQLSSYNEIRKFNPNMELILARCTENESKETELARVQERESHTYISVDALLCTKSHKFLWEKPQKAHVQRPDAATRMNNKTKLATILNKSKLKNLMNKSINLHLSNCSCPISAFIYLFNNFFNLRLLSLERWTPLQMSDQ